MTTRHIFFIDSNVADYELLLAALPPDSEWHVLNPETDGIEQMRQILSGYSGLDSIQIISHGSAGQLVLGNTTLNSSSLTDYADTLAAIGNSLTETGDLLLYGCNVAEGETGEEFIRQLAAITGADVAASTDLTGSAALGGDWVLEASAGQDDLPYASGLNASALNKYRGLLVESIFGGEGNDTLIGGAGNDYIWGGDGGDVLYGVGGNDTIVGDLGNDSILGGPGNDSLLGGPGNDSLSGEEGNDYLTGESGDDTVEGEGGDDTVEGGDGNDHLSGQTGNDHISGQTGNDSLYGDEGNDFLHGDDGNDVLYGENPFNLSYLYCNDTLYGGNGLDTLYGGAGNDLLYGFGLTDLGFVDDGSADTLYGGYGNDLLVGGGGNDYLDGGDGSDLLVGDEGNDSLYGGDGIDTLSYKEDGDPNGDGFGVTINLLLGTVFDNWGYTDRFFNIEWIIATDYADIVYGTNGHDTLDAIGGDDSLFGYSGNDTLYGEDGDDYLDGGDGDDYLDGGEGNDTLYGGVFYGDDTLLGGNGKDFLDGGDNNDLLYGGSGNDTLYGDNGDGSDGGLYGYDTLYGEDGNDLLYGGDNEDTVYGGNDDDTLYGGEWDDALYGDNGNDLIYGDSFGGSLIFYGDDTLYGGSGNDTLNGDHGDDLLYGEEGDDVLYGGNPDDYDYDPDYGSIFDGSDTLYGGDGNDTLYGGGGGNKLYGEDGNDSLVGGSWGDTLDGGPGADTMDGGYGDDIYFVNDPGDAVTEIQSGGTDWVYSSLSFSYWGNELLENLTLTGLDAINGTGNNLANIIIGNDAANVLTGHGGYDFLSGLGGNDTLDGGSGNDTLDGGAGDDLIDGGAGADTMDGKEGDDVFIVDNVDDVVTDSGGIDRVESSVNYTLGPDLENLTLTGSDPIKGTGNQLDNEIIGNVAANLLSGLAGNDTIIGGADNDTLDGGTGADAMDGGAGDNVFIIDNAGDVVTDSGGIDRVESSISYTLGPDLENLTLTGSNSINGTGNQLGNIVIGNGAANLLSGLDGNDSINGGAGNDTINGDAGNDTLDGGAGNDSLDGGDGADSVVAGDGDDSITGGAGNDTLDGGAGNDSLDGGDGADSVVAGGGSDSITGGAGNDTLNGGTGSDTAFFSGNRIDYTIINNGNTVTVTDNIPDRDGTDQLTSIEYLQFTDVTIYTASFPEPSNGLSLVGGFGDDPLVGSAGNDTLDGGAGNDTLDGGAGNDTLDGGDGADSVDGGDGNDTLDGGAGNDTLDGGAGNDTLDGGSGNDLIDGGLGSDSLSGGDGDDTFIVKTQSGDVDTLIGGEGRDTYLIDPMANGASTITDFKAGASGDVLDLSALLAASVGNNGNGADYIRLVQSGNDTLVQWDKDGAAGGYNWHTMVVLAGVNPAGVVAWNMSVTLTGTDGNDTLVGIKGNDSLSGGAGNDSLVSGSGYDTLDGGPGADTLVGGSGGDTYVVNDPGDAVIETDNSDDNTSRDLTIFDGAIAERLEKFYIAYYGRAADYDGLSYWKTTLTTVLNNEQIKMCGYFGNPLQTEFQNLYGTGNTNDTFLTNVYLNLFNRAPDSDGLNYWKGVITQLQAQGRSLDDARATVVIFVLDGAQGADAELIATKTENAVALSKVIARYDDDSNAYGNANNTSIFENARDWLKDLGSADFGNGSWELLYRHSVNEIFGIHTGDAVQSTINWTLGDFVEDLVLTGLNPINGTGNSLNNTIAGNVASNILTGGGGQDSFVFDTPLGPGNIDTLTDFNPAQDTIVLVQDIFTALPLGMLNANAFYIGTAAHDLDDRIVYNSANGNLSFDPDGNGAQAAQVFAVLPVGIALTHANIEVV